jgi:hypothetical protein
MSWRTIAAVIVFIFTMILLLPMTTIALPDTVNELNSTGDYDSRYLDGNSVMGDMVESVYSGVILAVMGIMAWGFARVVRKESSLLRGRR